MSHSDDTTASRPSSAQSSNVSAGDTGDVAALMSDLARSLQSEGSFEDTLQAITHAAVDMIPGAQMAGITLVREQQRVETRAATADVVNDIDAAQYETGEGPCLTALWDQKTVRSNDITTDDRWPTWRNRILEFGIRSMMSFQLFAGEGDLGALNFYATDLAAFDDDDENIGLLFAAHSAVALAGANETSGLRAALTNRDTIGQAKGILMERYDLDAEAAFRLLVRASQSTHIKLHDVAARIAHRD